jgi:hypothetical protein
MRNELFSNDMQRFEKAFAEWAARPPRTPAMVGARRVLARATSTAAPLPWARLLAAAVLVTLIVVTAWFGSGVASRPTAVALADLAPAPLPDNVMLWYVDPQTPVYLVLRPLGSQHGGAS